MGLLAVLSEYEAKHKTFMRIPHLEIYSDGSGRMMMMDVDMFHFASLSDCIGKMRAANKAVEEDDKNRAQP